MTNEVDTLVRNYHIKDKTGPTLISNPNIKYLCAGLGIETDKVRTSEQDGRTLFSSQSDSAMLSYALDMFLGKDYTLDRKLQYCADNTFSLFTTEGNRAIFQMRDRSYKRFCPDMPILEGIPLITLCGNKLIFVWKNAAIFELTQKQTELFTSCFAGLKMHLCSESVRKSFSDETVLRITLCSKKTQQLFYTAVGSFARSVVDRPPKVMYLRNPEPILICKKKS